MKKIIVCFFVLFTFLICANSTFAHVAVKPGTVGIGERLNFLVSVPTEEDNPTVGVRLVVPEGMASVRPNVKPGWNIEIVRTGEGEEERVSEIIWTGGAIPADQRDEFVFSAMAPSEETNLIWKAYQTYSNGLVVAWDQDPKVVEEYTKNNPPQEGVDHDHTAPKPYSQTTVINDLETVEQEAEKGIQGDTNALILSIVAIGLSALALGIQMTKKKK